MRTAPYPSSFDDGTAIADAVAICCYLEALPPEPALVGRTARQRTLTIACNRQLERDGFYAVTEAFRNATPGLKSRALPGPDDYRQIPALAEPGRARVDRFFARASIGAWPPRPLWRERAIRSPILPPL